MKIIIHNSQIVQREIIAYGNVTNLELDFGNYFSIVHNNCIYSVGVNKIKDTLVITKSQSDDDLLNITPKAANRIEIK